MSYPELNFHKKIVTKTQSGVVSKPTCSLQWVVMWVVRSSPFIYIVFFHNLKLGKFVDLNEDRSTELEKLGLMKSKVQVLAYAKLRFCRVCIQRLRTDPDYKYLDLTHLDTEPFRCQNDKPPLNCPRHPRRLPPCTDEIQGK